MHKISAVQTIRHIGESPMGPDNLIESVPKVSSIEQSNSDIPNNSWDDVFDTIPNDDMLSAVYLPADGHYIESMINICIGDL
ncbi:hypothetical protein N7478_005215 [Penicillium angulare]|uniref:uncharacterized protein n=1 Tax=Penicillium angulare TaxID=116970 RepID=UPI00253FA5CF|nr:uncharacterized protein N7478_005215 [Penicillium angulare]KAJ5279843.1 hypothetical protein N7478_005215 [Penicillium angulare]